MLEKIFTAILFFSAQFTFTAYGYFTGKIPTKGIYFGIPYDSIFIRALITQFEYLWILILGNFIFTAAFNIGLRDFKDYLIVAILWMVAAPIAVLIFNIIFVKEKIDWPIIAGIILVTLGAISVVAHKEIGKIFS